MRSIISLIVILITYCIWIEIARAKAIDCNQHKIYCGIVKLQPRVDKAYAMELSNAIYKYSKTYNMDWKRSVAILMQETSIRKGLNNVQKGFLKKTVCHSPPKPLEGSWRALMKPACETLYEVQEIVTDLGPWQFHVSTIVRLDLDPERIEHDIDYATKWHFKHLKTKLRACGKKFPDTAWACYNSATPAKHRVYVELVNRFYYNL